MIYFTRERNKVLGIKMDFLLLFGFWLRPSSARNDRLVVWFDGAVLRWASPSTHRIPTEHRSG